MWFSYSTCILAEKGNAYQKVMKFAATQNRSTLAIRKALVGHQLDQLNLIYNEVQALFKDINY